jgi:nucleoid DNA-binding protein
MLKDLKMGKQVKISNFGFLVLKQMKPRRYHNVKYQRVMMSEGHKILRFILAAPIRKKLVEHLDLDKTLKGD